MKWMQFLVCGVLCFWLGWTIGIYEPEKEGLAGVLSVVAAIITAVALLVILTAGGKAVLVP